MVKKIMGGRAIPVVVVATDRKFEGGRALPVVDVGGSGTSTFENMDVTGNATIGGTLVVTGDTTLNADLTVAGDARINGYLLIDEQSGAPTAIATVGQIWTQNDNMLYFQDGAGNSHIVHGYSTFKSYTVTTQGLGAGADVYAAGYYDAPVADANLDQGSATQTLGTASVAYAAHAFVVAGGAGSTDGSDLVLTVSGVSINDQGVRNDADSEIVVADCTAANLNEYFETAKKWLGQVTYTLTSSGGATFDFDFNYGWAKYEDWGNVDFEVTDIEVVGVAGGNDANADIIFYIHDGTGWTYSAAAFLPGGTVIASMVGDHGTNDQYANGDPFAWKRDNLSQDIVGSASEGVVVKFVTTGTNVIEFASVHIGVEF